MKDATFSSARLLSIYDRISDAPDAIPRLRRFVLDLAVRGKLVEQNAGDEPAAELLKRIAKEKARLVKAGEIKKSEVDSLPSDDEPFALPRNWAWTRLGSIGDWGAGSTPSRGDPELYGGSVTWLKSGELNDNTALAGSEETVTDVAVKKGSFRVNKPGDVLLAMYGATIGKLAILAETAVTNQAVCGCTPFDGIVNRFLFLFLLSYRAQFHAASEGGAQPNISKVKIVGTPFPLPPRAEQYRIVAKVDELMALCDQFEQARVGREAVRDRLTTASLARLTAPNTDAEAFQSHARFALQSLHTLTSRPDQIKTLRQTILNLAVRGKLVEQDAADEPAAELLKRIAKDKAQRAKVGEIRQEKLLSPLDPNQLPYGIPHGWQWVKLGTLVLTSDAGWSPKTLDHARENGEWGVLKVSAVSWNNFDASANKQVLPGTEPRLQAQVHRGDFLISRANTAELIARAVFVIDEPEKLMMSDKIVRLKLTEHCSHRYLWAVNNHADYARAHYIAHATGVSPSMKNVSRDVILGLAIPLPSLAEQHRIVARVDALLALCDQLEASLTTTATTRRTLLDALLHKALEPAAELEVLE